VSAAPAGGPRQPTRIRADERTRLLPVVILTSSRKERDVLSPRRPVA